MLSFYCQAENMAGAVHRPLSLFSAYENLAIVQRPQAASIATIPDTRPVFP